MVVHNLLPRNGWACIVVALMLLLPCASYAGVSDILDAFGASDLELFQFKCTWNLAFWTPNTILPMVQGVVFAADFLARSVIEDLFDGILDYDNSGAFDTPVFVAAAAAAATLFVIFYAIAFMFALAPLTIYEVVGRFVKIAIVMAFLGGDAWDLYEELFVNVFYEGVEEITNGVVDIGQSAITLGDSVGIGLSTGGLTIAILTGVSAPLAMFAKITAMVLSPRMLVIVLTCFGTAPYGLPMGFILGYGCFLVMTMFLRVVEVYGVSLIARAILLGVGPIFFIFLLFKKTKPLFIGWLNELISYSLQPILMFAVMSFFVPMLESSINSTVPRGLVEACYVPKRDNSGNITSQQAWRFALFGYPYQGDWGKNGLLLAAIPPLDTLLPDFPIHPMALLIFLIVAYTARQLVDISAELGREIAGGTVLLAKGD